MAAFEDAGRALGVVLATAVHIADPAAIVLTGDGLPVYDLARTTVDDSLRAALAPYRQPVTVEVQPFEFSEWARAGRSSRSGSCSRPDAAPLTAR
ncbi:hypothetical protein [Curtobacterium sp. 24E2]